MAKRRKLAVNPTKLVNLIMLREWELNEQIKTNKSATLRKLHTVAHYYLVTAADKIPRLADAVEEHAKKRQQRRVQLNKSTQELIAGVERLQQQRLQARDPQVKKTLDRQMDIAISSLKAQDTMVLLPALLNEALQKPLDELVNPLFQALEKAVKFNLSGIAKETGKATGRVAVSFVPVLGKIVSIAMQLNRLATLAEKQRKTADDYLAFIEAYSYALMKWCEKVDEIVDILTA